MVRLSSSIRKVLILGASGFVGSRLAEKLYLDHRHVARCLYRDHSRIARLARFPFELVHGDILNPEEYDFQIKDCDVYIFCIHGKDKNSSMNRAVNVKGLANVLEQAARNHAQQFIYLSTTAIYEERLDEGDISESVDIRKPRSDYAIGKWEGEKLCASWTREYGIPTTILRPTLIYGPFAPSWTIYPSELIRSGAIKDFGNFSGLANPVYVDDVVDAIISCVLNEKAFGESFIVTGNDCIEWKRYFDAYSLIVRGTALERGSLLQYYFRAFPLRLLKTILKLAVRMMPRFIKKVYGRLTSRGRGNWSWARGTDVSSIRLGFYRKRLRYSGSKLTEKLGFSPEYDFEQGMQVTASWLRHHRYTLQ